MDVFYEHKNVAFFIFVRLFNVFMLFVLVKFSRKEKIKKSKIVLITSTIILLPLWSNAYNDVTNLRFVDFTKSQKPRYLENETSFSFQKKR